MCVCARACVVYPPELTQPVASNILRSRGSPESCPSILVREWQVAMQATNWDLTRLSLYAFSSDSRKLQTQYYITLQYTILHYKSIQYNTLHYTWPGSPYMHSPPTAGNYKTHHYITFNLADPTQEHRATVHDIALYLAEQCTKLLGTQHYIILHVTLSWSDLGRNYTWLTGTRKRMSTVIYSYLVNNIGYSS